MRTAFYAIMGGFAIDIPSSFPHHAHLFPNTDRLTLTATGYDLLARLNLAPHIAPEDIDDKNKTDVMAKMIVIIQAGWMLVQTVGRKAAGLPLTLLEVHTVAHVVCALALYGIWWDKPRQVGAPTKVDFVGNESRILELIILLYLASGVSQGEQKGLVNRILHPWDLQRGELAHLDLVENSKAMTEKLSRSGTPLSRQKRYFVDQPIWGSRRTRRQPPTSEDGADDLRTQRRRLALEALENNPLLQDLFEPKSRRRAGRATSPTTNHTLVLRTLGDYLQPHAPNFELRSTGLISLSLPRAVSLPITSVLWLSSMVYGAIHLAAWKYFFPTTIESFLWRVSSAWVTTCSSLCLVVHLLGVSDWNAVVMFQSVFRLIRWAHRVVDTLVKVLVVLYVLARGFLVVEAFVSLRRVPRGVYNEVQWMDIIPHL